MKTMQGQGRISEERRKFCRTRFFKLRTPPTRPFGPPLHHSQEQMSLLDGEPLKCATAPLTRCGSQAPEQPNCVKS